MHLLDVKYLEPLKITIIVLPDNIHAENSIYYNGAFVLQVIKEKERAHILDLYADVKIKKEMSMSIFVLCLDWLYLLDVVMINNRGEIELCS